MRAIVIYSNTFWLGNVSTFLVTTIPFCFQLPSYIVCTVKNSPLFLHSLPHSALGRVYCEKKRVGKETLLSRIPVCAFF